MMRHLKVFHNRRDEGRGLRMVSTRSMCRLFVGVVVLPSVVGLLGGCVWGAREVAVTPTPVFGVVTPPVSGATRVSPPPVAGGPPGVIVPEGVRGYPVHVREWMGGEGVWAGVRAYWELWVEGGLVDMGVKEGALLTPVFGGVGEPIYPAVVVDGGVWLPPLDLEASAQEGRLVFREPPLLGGLPIRSW